MTKRILIMLACVLVLVAALGYGFYLHIQTLIASAPKPGPQTVSSTIVKADEWQPQLPSVGSLVSIRGVDISSEVAGLVRTVAYKSGHDVAKGQLLVQLNADADVAQLHALEASAELAAITLKRDRAQLEAQGVSQAQVDNDAADLKNKTALAAQQAALVEKKTIRAPFAGRIGISTVQPGLYLNPGDKIVTLQTIDPIYVDFYLPQERIGALSIGQPVTARSDAFPGVAFTGKITSISPKIDTTTRNVQIEARLRNPQRQLLPGMYVKAAVDVGVKQRYLTLPQTAITYNPYGSTVFLVKPGKSGGLEVQQAFVTTGETRGDQVAILKGLEEGQQVVTSGQIKLKNGTPVIIDNTVRPDDNPRPTPQEH